ncbi:IS110 family transposase, partial [uncultured Duncaniella sp.]
VTATELIIKTGNFKRVGTAKKCATLAGIAPFPNSTGKSDKGSHVSHMGDKQLKSLLFMCANSAILHFEKMRIYKMKKHEVEHKHIFVVLNNVANRLLKILYALIKKGEMYDPKYLQADPRLKTQV